MFQERLKLLVPPGEDQFHRLLQSGCGLRYERVPNRYYSLVKRFPLEIIELRSTDIPKIVAEGYAALGCVFLEDVLNLPDLELTQVKTLRNLGFGKRNLTLGVSEDTGYSEYSKVEDIAGKRVATAFPVLVQRIFDERGIQVEIVKMAGLVEIAIRYNLADVIVGSTETGGTMRRNDLIPAECLMSFEAVLIGSTAPLERGIERIRNSLLNRVDKALKRPEIWLQ